MRISPTAFETQVVAAFKENIKRTNAKQTARAKKTNKRKCRATLRKNIRKQKQANQPQAIASPPTPTTSQLKRKQRRNRSRNSVLNCGRTSKQANKQANKTNKDKHKQTSKQTNKTNKYKKQL